MSGGGGRGGGEIMNYELENNSSFMNKIIIHYSHLE